MSGSPKSKQTQTLSYIYPVVEPKEDPHRCCLPSYQNPVVEPRASSQVCSRDVSSSKTTGCHFMNSLGRLPRIQEAVFTSNSLVHAPIVAGGFTSSRALMFFSALGFSPRAPESLDVSFGCDTNGLEHVWILTWC